MYMCSQQLEEEFLTFVKKQLKNIYRVLVSDYPKCLESVKEEKQSSREAVLNIFVDFLRRMKHEQLAESLGSEIVELLLSHTLKRGYTSLSVCEGVAKPGDSTLLKEIYTELYITEGGAAEVNQEHEVRHIETASRKPATPEQNIKCEDIFEDLVHRQGPVRTVMSKGVAGIGKTVLTRKFSLDWAEGKANQNIHLLFPFTFRELNVLRDTQFSLVGLLSHFFSELCSFEQLQVLFIFDGLDECRLPLDFGQTRILTDPKESASVHELLVNLIRGTLLPSALLWITTRPAAANQIPAEYVSLVTEVRGFTDSQKEKYFRKRFTDEQQATAIISHITRSRSLHAMCRIPVFCWIFSTVLDHVMKTRAIGELPQTLTEMYIHFLVVQAKIKSLKYDGRSETDPLWTKETREMVWALGNLAFEQLQKGNLIFYESDLVECELDVATASMSSGVFTQVFREESGLYQDTVYSFIHLSVQEFLAALYIHQAFFSYKVNLLSTEQFSESLESEVAFYCSAVDLTLQSPNGHLDLFLRFLLGLSLPTNQNLLPGLLTQRSRFQTNMNVAKYIKKKLDEDLPAERRMNLLQCLIELNDRSLVNDIQCSTRKGHSRHWSSAEWSGLAFLLLSSNSDLEEFDLRKYYPSETALMGLLPVIKSSTKAFLCNSNLSPHSCGPLARVLTSTSLTHLDLSNNDLKDSGVEQLCSGLKNTPCSLQKLRLSGCLVSERGGAALASALSSSNAQLRELDLSYNHPGPSAELLTALRDDPLCPLESIRLNPAGDQWMVPGLHKYFPDFYLALDSNTANQNLKLLDPKNVKHVEREEPYSEHRDRFDSCPQVLCSSGLTGSCYWEVQWNGKMVYIAACYKIISRKEDQGDCFFGENEWSWNMRISDGRYSFRHNGLKSGAEFHCHHTSAKSSSQEAEYSGRVGVFLDYEGGFLSFYEVLSNGDRFHLHTFSSTFTEPLFPGFGLWSGSSVSLVK
uniref:B30.2/SPRY domain-containing protein n=1 Tax=Periophthalmus magnuspinnatus TaxID=409849 RepID=A0A3B3ZHT6_9GOBI